MPPLGENAGRMLIDELFEIAAVFARHGLGDLIRRAGLAPLFERAGVALRVRSARGLAE